MINGDLLQLSVDLEKIEVVVCSGSDFHLCSSFHFKFKTQPHLFKKISYDQFKVLCTCIMENEANGLTDTFVARHTTDRTLRLELLSRNQNGLSRDQHTVMGTEVRKHILKNREGD